MWAGDTGDELVLLSTFFRKTILVFQKCFAPVQIQNSINSTDGPLYCISYYEAYKNMPIEIPQPENDQMLPIFLDGANHFQALVPPLSASFSSIGSLYRKMF